MHFLPFEHKNRLPEYLNLVILLAATVGHFALGIHEAWILYGVGLVLLLLCNRRFARDMTALYVSLFILGWAEISTDLSTHHIVSISVFLLAAVIIPYAMSRFLFKDYTITYNLHHGRHWYRNEILYILVSMGVAYFVLPFYLKNTGAWQNWYMENTWNDFGRLFLGTNGVGMWDELYFVNTILFILRKHLTFWVANCYHALIFASFLYELGFISWGFIVIFLFAIIQGSIYRHTNSLFYLITIHLCVDLILYFALINARYPDVFDFFLL